MFVLIVSAPELDHLPKCVEVWDTYTEALDAAQDWVVERKLVHTKTEHDQEFQWTRQGPYQVAIFPL